jgi:hypothetical protein
MSKWLVIFAVVALARAERPSADLPADAQGIVRRSLEHESLDLDPPTLPDYTYTVEDEEKKLNADGSVRSASSETREVMNLYGGHFERLIRRNGQELPAEKSRAEREKFDKAVEKLKRETPERKAAREEAMKKARARKNLCNEEFLKMFDARVAGSEELNGRTSWIVEMNPRPNPSPAAACGGDLKILAKFHIKLWIDQEEYRWARFAADNIAPVSFGKILIRMPAGGAYFLYEQIRHEDGVWLTSRDRLRGFAKVMLAAPYRMDETETYSGYRKYQAESRIVTDEAK